MWLQGKIMLRLNWLWFTLENYHNQCKLIYFSKSSLKLYLKKLEVNTNYSNYGLGVP